MALTWKGAPFVWTDHQQHAFEALKACLISAPILGFPTEADSPVPDVEPTTGLVDQPFASSEMGESVDADLLPELSGETWVASALLEEFTADLLPAGADLDLIAASRQDATLVTVREWIQSDSVLVWAEWAGLSPELRCWRLQVGNLSIDTDGRLWRRRAPPSVGSQLVVPQSERRSMIHRFHDSLFAGHLGINLGRCFAFRPGCTGPDYDRTFDRLWHLARCASPGLVERFNRTLLMMLAMFAGEHKDDWDDLLPPVMMVYRSSVHELPGFSPYWLMFGEECTLPMDIGLPRQDPDPQEGSRACMLSGLRTRWRWRLIRSVVTRVRLYNDKTTL